MATNPNLFAEFFMREQYPTMGLAPSAVIAKTGPVAVQEGGSTIARTGQTMWSRISNAIPFGFTIDGLLIGKSASEKAAGVVVQKIEEGAQAVNGKVKKVTESVTNGVRSYVNYSKWIIAGLVAVAFIVFAAQVKTLVKT